MRIGVLTNFDESCGIAEYGRDLESYIRGEGIDVVREANPEAMSSVDVVLVNYHIDTMPLSVGQARSLQESGKKVILILHNSWHEPFTVAGDDILAVVDAVVAHEKMSGNVKVHYIPHGIPVVESLPPLASDKRIGVAGFPFSQKRMDLSANIAKDNGAILRMIAPHHNHPEAWVQADLKRAVDQVQGIMPPGRLELIQEFLPKDTVVRMLAECTMTMFWYESQIAGDSLAQSGSARMGLAARRPIIVPMQRKFWTICEYEDEIYVAKSESDAANMAREIFEAPEKARIPNRILVETNWRESAKQYINLAKETMG